MNRRPWTREALAALERGRGLPAGDRVWTEIATALARMPHEVLCRARYGGLVQPTPRHAWTADEDTWLELHWETADRSAIRRRFPGLPWSTIYSHAVALGLGGHEGRLSLNAAAARAGVHRRTLAKILRRHCPGALRALVGCAERPREIRRVVAWDDVLAAMAAWNGTETVTGYARRNDLSANALWGRLVSAGVIVPQTGQHFSHHLPTVVLDHYAKLPKQQGRKIARAA